ncbi:MAG TPA: MBL fold metallo-hydrolase [Vicinamibacterales bacterium]|nr:MBL fold metallo-hydrolase [Vicinamibacterales bacterium]
MNARDVVTPLGSGGWIPGPHRQTSCYLIRDASHALVLDAGTGFGRLTTSPSFLAGVRTVTVVLSHFHLDHVAGLAMVGADFSDAYEVVVAGPGAELYGTSTAAIVNDILGRPFQTSNPLRGARFVDIGEQLRPDLGYDLSYRHQRRHPLPSIGVRLADRLSYCTDTEADPGTTEFAAGVGLLLHEAWAPINAEAGHTSAADASRIAAAAGVSSLALTHIDQRQDPGELLSAAVASMPNTQVATDLVPLAIPT